MLRKHGQFAVGCVCGATRRLLHAQRDAGYCDRALLCKGFQALAKLVPPGEASSLQLRQDFCADCLQALLPLEEAQYGGGGISAGMELRLRLRKGALLPSAIGELGGFSEAGVRAGALRQELLIEYEDSPGEDAGGLRRQFFDEIPHEMLAAGCAAAAAAAPAAGGAPQPQPGDTPLWQLTPAGALRPLDGACAARYAEAQPAGAAREGAVGRRRSAHYITAGRIFGMALYQELHRRIGVAQREPSHTQPTPAHCGRAVRGGGGGMMSCRVLRVGSGPPLPLRSLSPAGPDIYANQPPNLLGLPLARYFIAQVQHAAPRTLDELQAALNEEELEAVRRESARA
eukprot:COSAG01_NODE_3379_length_6171_cov_17.073287_3_plen_343_part_00